VTGRPGPVALVIAAAGGHWGRQDADVVLEAGEPAAAQLSALWAGRIQPFAREMAGLATTRLGPDRKRLYVRPDPGQHSILHVRLLGAPWQADTVAFRDWLRSDPDGRAAYEQAKLDAARAHAADADFDDYTRAKTSFFRSAAQAHGAWRVAGT
jgi:GrpB-like predicted nucleotidyltransferase (UPF0157 family)